MKIKSDKNLLKIIFFSKRLIIICLLFCIIAQSFPQGIVLCFEDDGRFEVEFGSKEQCCQAFNESSRNASSIIFSEQDYNSHCGTCLDVVLCITAEKNRKSKSFILDQLVSLLQKSSYFVILFDKSTLKNSFLVIPTTAFHIATTQTVILLV